MPLVLDASVTAASGLADENSAYADAAMDLAVEQGAVVPSVWWYEVRNILIVAERRGRSTEPHSAQFLLALGRLPIAIDRDQESDMVLALARTHNLTAYDAAYLETAVRRDAILATLDRTLAKAAERQGVALLSA